MSRPPRHICVQGSIFRGKNGRFWAKHSFWEWAKVLVPTYHKTTLALFFWSKWARIANIWPKMTKNAYFGPNLAGFDPNIRIFLGGSKSKSFDFHLSKSHLGTSFSLFLVGHRTKWPKRPIFGSKWPKLPILGQNSIFLGGSKTFGTFISGHQWDISRDLQGRKCAILTPKFGYLGPNVNFFGTAIFVNRAYRQLVSYPTRWSLLFIFGCLYGSSFHHPSNREI